ncbi:MAG: hypothetical protein ACLFN5_05715 [bacterium]
MVKRQRPRLSLTVDAKLKKRVKRVAASLNISVSRLFELLVDQFLLEYESNPQLGDQIKARARRMEKSRLESGEEKKKREAAEILHLFDSV